MSWFPEFKRAAKPPPTAGRGRRDKAAYRFET